MDAVYWLLLIANVVGWTALVGGALFFVIGGMLRGPRPPGSGG